MKPQWTTIEHYVCFDPAEGETGFEDLIGPESDGYDWVEGDEREPAMLCYTSGTTGNPKGVLYEHRSTVLHAMAEMSADCLDLSARTVALPIVPMFHAAAWGLPFAAPAAGAKLVFSADYTPQVLCDLMSRERVTHSAGVPTVWLAMMQHLDATGADLGTLQIVTIGGSAAPRAMIEYFVTRGVRVGHAWGMTEMSPIGTVGAPPAGWAEMSQTEQIDYMCKQGRAPFGVDLRIVDDENRVLPRDGTSSGRLQARGPWIVQTYFKDEGGPSTDSEGWFDTGRCRHPAPRRGDADHRPFQGRDQIGRRMDQLDRARECRRRLPWRRRGGRGRRPSSQVGRTADPPHRPQARRRGDGAGDPRLPLQPRRQMVAPDEILFVESLPHTATGKLLKTAIREQYRDYKLATAA
jgi:fatty-acyl-CoA synthase